MNCLYLCKCWTFIVVVQQQSNTDVYLSVTDTGRMDPSGDVDINNDILTKGDISVYTYFIFFPIKIIS